MSRSSQYEEHGEGVVVMGKDVSDVIRTAVGNSVREAIEGES